MIKLLIILAIVLIAFWMGARWASSGKEKEKDEGKKTYNNEDVIDIEPEE